MNSKLLSKVEIDKIIIPDDLIEMEGDDEGKISIVNYVIEQMVKSYEFNIVNEEEDNFVNEQFKLIDKEIMKHEGGVIGLVKEQFHLGDDLTEEDAYYFLTEKIIEQFRAAIIATAYCKEKDIIFNEVTYRSVLEDLKLQMGVDEEEAEELYPLETYLIISPMMKLVNDIIVTVTGKDVDITSYYNVQ